MYLYVTDDQYKKWCENFHLDSKKGEISELLVNNHDVRRLYTSFVSKEISLTEKYKI